MLDGIAKGFSALAGLIGPAPGENGGKEGLPAGFAELFAAHLSPLKPVNGAGNPSTAVHGIAEGNGPAEQEGIFSITAVIGMESAPAAAAADAQAETASLPASLAGTPVHTKGENAETIGMVIASGTGRETVMMDCAAVVSSGSVQASAEDVSGAPMLELMIPVELVPDSLRPAVVKVDRGMAFIPVRIEGMKFVKDPADESTLIKVFVSVQGNNSPGLIAKETAGDAREVPPEMSADASSRISLPPDETDGNEIGIPTGGSEGIAVSAPVLQAGLPALAGEVVADGRALDSIIAGMDGETPVDRPAGKRSDTSTRRESEAPADDRAVAPNTALTDEKSAVERQESKPAGTSAPRESVEMKDSGSFVRFTGRFETAAADAIQPLNNLLTDESGPKKGPSPVSQHEKAPAAREPIRIEFVFDSGGGQDAGATDVSVQKSSAAPIRGAIIAPSSWTGVSGTAGAIIAPSSGTGVRTTEGEIRIEQSPSPSAQSVSQATVLPPAHTGEIPRGASAGDMIAMLEQFARTGPVEVIVRTGTVGESGTDTGKAVQPPLERIVWNDVPGIMDEPAVPVSSKNRSIIPSGQAVAPDMQASSGSRISGEGTADVPPAAIPADTNGRSEKIQTDSAIPKYAAEIRTVREIPVFAPGEQPAEKPVAAINRESRGRTGETIREAGETIREAGETIRVAGETSSPNPSDDAVPAGTIQPKGTVSTANLGFTPENREIPDTVPSARISPEKAKSPEPLSGAAGGQSTDTERSTVEIASAPPVTTDEAVEFETSGASRRPVKTTMTDPTPVESGDEAVMKPLPEASRRSVKGNAAETFRFTDGKTLGIVPGGFSEDAEISPSGAITPEQRRVNRALSASSVPSAETVEGVSRDTDNSKNAAMRGDAGPGAAADARIRPVRMIEQVEPVQRVYPATGPSEDAGEKPADGTKAGNVNIPVADRSDTSSNPREATDVPLRTSVRYERISPQPAPVPGRSVSEESGDEPAEAAPTRTGAEKISAESAPVSDGIESPVDRSSQIPDLRMTGRTESGKRAASVDFKPGDGETSSVSGGNGVPEARADVESRGKEGNSRGADHGNAGMSSNGRDARESTAPLPEEGNTVALGSVEAGRIRVKEERHATRENRDMRKTAGFDVAPPPVEAAPAMLQSPGTAQNAAGLNSPRTIVSGPMEKSADQGLPAGDDSPLFRPAMENGGPVAEKGRTEMSHTPFRVRRYQDVETGVMGTVVRQARFLLLNRQSSATVVLEPPSLGRLSLDIVTENSRITGKITVESHEVRDIIRANLGELRQNLAQNGFMVESFDVQVGHNGGSDAWARRQEFEDLAAMADSVRAASGVIPENRSESAMESRAAGALYAGGFDIRV